MNIIHIFAIYNLSNVSFYLEINCIIPYWKCNVYLFMFNRMCREAIQPEPPLPASVEVRSAYKKYSSSAIVLRGVSLTVRRNTMYEYFLLNTMQCVDFIYTNFKCLLPWW